MSTSWSLILVLGLISPFFISNPWLSKNLKLSRHLLMFSLIYVLIWAWMLFNSGINEFIAHLTQFVEVLRYHQYGTAELALNFIASDSTALSFRLKFSLEYLG